VPEGQSLVLAARRLQPIVGAAVIDGPLTGARITSVESRGKHLLIAADDGRTLHVHLGLHGAVRLRPPGEGSGRHLLRTAAGDAVVHHPVRFDVRRSALLRLGIGPDLLGNFDPEAYLRRARLVDRPLGEMVVDQRVLAGIGNIVKSEALWEARLDPFAPVSTFDDDQLGSIALVAARILEEGVRAGGRLPSRVYRRTGRPCPRCTAPIRMERQGEARRSTYFCPTCQCG
jgi:endonuclease VIII